MSLSQSESTILHESIILQNTACRTDVVYVYTFYVEYKKQVHIQANISPPKKTKTKNKKQKKNKQKKKQKKKRKERTEKLLNARTCTTTKYIYMLSISCVYNQTICNLNSLITGLPSEEFFLWTIFPRTVDLYML